MFFSHLKQITDSFLKHYEDIHVHDESGLCIVICVLWLGKIDHVILFLEEVVIVAHHAWWPPITAPSIDPENIYHSQNRQVLFPSLYHTKENSYSQRKSSRILLFERDIMWVFNNALK